MYIREEEKINLSSAKALKLFNYLFKEKIRIKDEKQNYFEGNLKNVFFFKMI